MESKNALKIIKRRLEENPELKKAYLEEKKNYQVGCKIREYRKLAGMTQEQLAQLIGTKQSVISRLENAEYTGHSLSILQKISSALNQPLENFIFSEKKSDQILTLHIPQITRKAASFEYLNTDQIIIKRSNAG